MKKEPTLQEQSFAFSLLRFPMAVLVVYIHAYFLEGMCSDEGSNLFHSGFFSYIAYSCSFVLPSSAVPLFFLISGYFFFFKESEFTANIFKSKIAIRLKTLMLPYVAWNVLAILYNLLVHKGFINYLGNGTEGILSGLFNEVVKIWCEPTSSLFGEMTVPVNLPLWFLRDLFVVMVFTPVLYPILIKPFSRFFVIFLTALLFVKWIPTYWIPGMGLNSLTFFSIGAWCGIRKINILKAVWKYRRVLILLYIFFSVLDVILWSLSAQSYFKEIVNWHQFVILIGIPFYIIIAYALLYKLQWITKLSSCSFVVYALHYIVIFDIFRFFLRVNVMGDFGIMIIYFIVPILIIFLSYWFFTLLNKREFLRLIFLGGR